MTPQKLKEPGWVEQNFIVKTSSAIYSSVKKIMSQNVKSLKNILPSFKKVSAEKDNVAKPRHLSFCNYEDLYDSLFVFEAFKLQQPKSCSFSKANHPGKQEMEKYGKQEMEKYDKQEMEKYGKQEMEKYGKQEMEKYGKQEMSENQKQTQDTDDEPADSRKSDMSVSAQFGMSIKKSKIVQEEESDGKQNIASHNERNELRESSSEIVKKKYEQEEERKSKFVKKGGKEGGRIKQEALRVAEMRKYAAKLCREKSRTPIKKRLRSRKAG